MPPAKDNETLEELYTKGNSKLFFQKKLEMTKKEIEKTGTSLDFLFPSLDDPQFNKKIATRREFFDTQYDGKITDIRETSDEICNADFELAPHQAFVRNFLSFQTPYNGLLLYHGLGSGKTCSAISVAEEMRQYMKQMGLAKKIIIVASPNVQDNFRLQLFDERKLKEQNGFWNIRACVGNSFLKEINPMNIRGMPRERVISQVNKIIRESYEFFGYIEFANFISRVKADVKPMSGDESEDKATERRRRKIRSVFDDRLIIIDEAHEIRISDDNKDKRVAMELRDVVRSTDNLRLLLLSATPMFNSYKEVIWLINLLLLNDKREQISLRDVFDDDGDFKTDPKTGEAIGRNLLERKATGYVSFVRGENPYSFPFKVWPSQFAKKHTLSKTQYPTQQLNDKEIVNTIEHLELYVSKVGEYQNKVYSYIIERLKQKAEMGEGGVRNMPSFENMESFGYTLLQRPLESLNISYPSEQFDEYLKDAKSKTKKQSGLVDPKDLVGKGGLSRVMKFKEPGEKTGFKTYEYRTGEYEGMFSPSKIENYSCKIKAVTDSIMNSEGIVIVYSQYIDGGLVPTALALEELGFSRLNSGHNLFKTQPTPPIDSLTYKPAKKGEQFKKASYIMITGEKSLSPDNLAEFKACTNPDNKDGSIVKVVLLSQAGGQGLDFTNIRQVHILEPWYNMNRLEQVIGRAVRNCSHKSLPLEKRNVQIFLHGSLLRTRDTEAADLYVYRTAEAKAVQIGEVSRVLKEIAVDCLLNTEQQNFTAKNMKQTLKITLSTKQKVEYEVGDKPYTFACDYLDTCEYKCKPIASVSASEVIDDTYSKAFINNNNERILQRVRDLFKEKHVYDKQRLRSEINAIRTYPNFQIDSALSQLTNDRNELVSDKFGRIGRVVNLGILYMFQPLELTNNHQTLLNRRVPLRFKRDTVVLKQLPSSNEAERAQEDTEELVVSQVGDKSDDLLKTMKAQYDMAFSDVAIKRGEEDWYVYASAVTKQLERENVDKQVIQELMIAHIVELLMFDQLLSVMNYVYNKKKLTEFEQMVKKYVEDSLIKSGKDEGLLWVKNSSEALIAKEGKKWVEGKSEDWRILREKIDKLKVTEKELNNVFGFIDEFKGEQMVFKVRQTDKKRNKGARCDQAGKKAALAILNLIEGDAQYTIESTKDVNQRQICVLQELLLRLYNLRGKDGMIWFVGPGVAALSKVDNPKR
jgi:hypothetical protein